MVENQALAPNRPSPQAKAAVTVQAATTRHPWKGRLFTGDLAIGLKMADQIGGLARAILEVLLPLGGSYDGWGAEHRKAE